MSSSLLATTVALYGQGFSSDILAARRRKWSPGEHENGYGAIWRNSQTARPAVEGATTRVWDWVSFGKWRTLAIAPATA